MVAVDFKVTTWERITIPEEHLNLIAQLIDKGEITCATDLYNIEEIAGELDFEMLPEVSEQMSVEENGGCSIIELILNGEVITTNLKN